jgi:cell division protein FtsW
MLKTKQQRQHTVHITVYDKWFVATVLCLMLIGLMMVASSSVMMATKFYHQPFYFLIRKIVYL